MKGKTSLQRRGGRNENPLALQRESSRSVAFVMLLSLLCPPTLIFGSACTACSFTSILGRFVLVPDADKKGLPRVVDSMFVSSKTKYNIRALCNLLYRTAFDIRTAGSKERLLDQKIPASYLALEKVIPSNSVVLDVVKVFVVVKIS